MSERLSEFELQQQLYKKKGIAVDAFGEPISDDLAGIAEVRTIELTPDIIAADAAAREAREERKEGITWRRPEPVITNYQFPVHRSNGKRPSTKSREAKAEVPSAPAPAQPAPPLKEEPPMSDRICAHTGCTVKLQAKNTTPFCSAHRAYVPKAAAEKPATAKTSVKKSPSQAPPSLTPKPLAQLVTGGEGIVLLPVPEASLDAFLSRLPVADKVRIVAAEMMRGL